MIKHAQQRQSISEKTIKKRLPSFMVGYALGPPATGSNLPIYQDPASHLHFLDTVKVILKLKEVLHLEFIPIADHLQNSL